MHPLAGTREAVRRIRATKAMLITPGDEDCRSAGSLFKNPVLATDQYAELTLRAKGHGIAGPQLSGARRPAQSLRGWLERST